LLDYENAHIATQNQNSLKELAEEARRENYQMRMLTEKSTRDSEAIKVITILTIVFLPATVVAVSVSNLSSALVIPLNDPVRAFSQPNS